MQWSSAHVLARFVNVVLTIFEAFLGLRLALKLFGANPSAAFTDWVYTMTEPLLAPFAGMFPAPSIEHGLILEFSTLFAMLAYAIAGWLLVELIEFTAEATKQKRTDKQTDTGSDAQ